MASPIEELRTRFDTEEQACLSAQRRIDNGGLIGGLIGRFQRWIHTGELQQITDELNVAELYQRLDKGTQ